MSCSPIISLKARCALFFVVLSTSISVCSEALPAGSLNSPASLNSTLTLKYALQKVRSNDLSLVRFGIDAQSYRAEADANEYLPDPTLFAAVQSIPTDTFDLDQEPMTQLRFGVRQMFPKGNSLDIKKDMSLINSGIQGIKQNLRWQKLRLNTEVAWLEAWYWQKNKQLIEEDRVFLIQVQDFIQSLYQIGAKGQSDLIGAQLELIKLNEKQIEADRQFRRYRHRLNTLANETLLGDQLSQDLVQIDQIGLDLSDTESVVERLLKHPEVRVLDQHVDLFEKKVNLAEQAFEPMWGLEFSYGLRDGENNDGSNRADFLSAGVSVQLPLFTQGKQNSALTAARFKQESIQNNRLELIQKMSFQLESVHQQYLSTVDQRQLYENQILPTLAKQKESALNSYESDQGDFRTVTELFIKELDTKIKHQRLQVNEQLMIAKMNYWISSDSEKKEREESTNKNRATGELTQ
ncbi:MAG: outer membrane protein TolC [Oleiphilaceae bacterium]|jgi:outer membrane protein TolC